MSTFVPHPIPYQGSKRNLAKHILLYFPAETARLIEPFAGSAAVSLAARLYRKVATLMLGDSDESLMKLWDTIVNEPDRLASAYRELWEQQQGRERIFYDEVRAKFNRTHRPDLFLYLLARCVKAAVRYNTKGEFNQSPDNRRKGMQPDTMQVHISAAAELLRGHVELICADYRETLANATPQDIVYLDPPYQGVCKKRDPRYRDKVSFENFIAALAELNVRRIPYIVSYDGRTETKTYGQVLPAHLGLTRIEIDAGRSAQATLLGRKATTYESLYLSPELTARIKPMLDQSVPRQLELFNA